MAQECTEDVIGRSGRTPNPGPPYNPGRSESDLLQFGVDRSYEVAVYSGEVGVEIRIVTLPSYRTLAPAEVERVTAEVAYVVFDPASHPRFPRHGEPSSFEESRKPPSLLDALYGIISGGTPGDASDEDARVWHFASHVHTAPLCVTEEPLRLPARARSLASIDEEAVRRSIRAAGIVGPGGAAGDRSEHLVVLTLHSGVVVCGRGAVVSAWLGVHRRFLGLLMSYRGAMTKGLYALAGVAPKASATRVLPD